MTRSKSLLTSCGRWRGEILNAFANVLRPHLKALDDMSLGETTGVEDGVTKSQRFAFACAGADRLSASPVKFIDLGPTQGRASGGSGA
jgi:hypothetical protein